ncbi:MAG: M20/M25/M40 family metallo-hydrolase [Erysipelotrichaceae bacterium]|nr:M20/M25/M40 family metallo-hydrolase [Erysipelotrichaceae bacterium]
MNKELLEKLLNTVSVSGNEEPNQENVLEYVREFTDEQRTDSVGNVLAVINPESPVKVLLTGHVDEIGYRVTHVSSDGLVHVQKAGGVRHKLYIGAPMQIMHETVEDGKKIRKKVEGVGVVSSALLKKTDYESTDLLIDIGCSSKEEAMKLVSVGDSVCADTTVHYLQNDIISCRALDDKAGVYIVAEAARRAREKGTGNGIYIHSAVGEETTGRGAFKAAAQVKPSCVIAVDVTWASDCPGTDPAETGEVKLGGGPVLCMSGMVNKKMNGLLEKIAQEKGINIQKEVAGGYTHTDGDTMTITGEGVPVALVSIPERYMHSSVEMVSMKDLEDCIELISEFAVRMSLDFNYDPLG